MKDKLIVLFKKVKAFYDEGDPWEKNALWIIVFVSVVAAIALTCPGKAEAGEAVHSSSTTNNSYHYNSTKNLGGGSGMALGVAASLAHHYYGTSKFQGSVSAATVEDETAVSFSVAKKPCKTCPLFNGALTTDGDNMGYGAAINFIFK